MPVMIFDCGAYLKVWGIVLLVLVRSVYFLLGQNADLAVRTHLHAEWKEVHRVREREEQWGVWGRREG